MSDELLTPTPAPAPHSLLEDIQGLLTGCLFVALGVCMFREAGLFTGGTTGVAFLTHYLLGYPLGAVLFVINLPFYVFGWRKLGHLFTFKTFAAVGLLSAYVELLPQWVGFEHLNPVFAAVMAGLLAGTGILILIRHGASLGGVTIMAIYFQKTRGWRAGNVQMAVDFVILLTAFAVSDVQKALLSMLGAVALNVVIGVNHRTDRYYGV
ncbi:YitT family protein [Limnohabitans sp. TS-CS-82]|uniref:YitT family protein n=1 Tax=Limnohabitans sp. TS-CS-82 TaxID=2094193 RepID=UPI0021014953|nr:YitT family protein [Limnohabitans sp. TS-CS-82]